MAEHGPPVATRAQPADPAADRRNGAGAGGRGGHPAARDRSDRRADRRRAAVRRGVHADGGRGRRTADADPSGSGSFRSREIPATLQDLLMARLDRIDANIEVAQLGAAIGREFSHELIFAVSPFEPPALQTELEKLVAAEVLVARGRAPRTHYAFKHALIQDAAYGSLVKLRRQEFHHRIAEGLEARYADLAATQPELLAMHFTEAGKGARAIDYWDRAGRRSLAWGAYKEATEHFRRGLALLPALPESPERLRRELDLLTALGVPLQATIGYSAPEVERTYTRAHELCTQLGLSAELFPILYGMFRYYMLQAKYPKARELGVQLLAVAQRGQTPHNLVAANRAGRSAGVRGAARRSGSVPQEGAGHRADPGTAGRGQPVRRGRSVGRGARLPLVVHLVPRLPRPRARTQRRSGPARGGTEPHVLCGARRQLLAVGPPVTRGHRAHPRRGRQGPRDQPRTRVRVLVRVVRGDARLDARAPRAAGGGRGHDPQRDH